MKIYLNIIKAAKEIWYDNGMINRLEPEAEKVELLLNWLQTLDSKLLEPIELELSKLSEEDFETVCCGEETEQERLASESLNEFLNRIFDEEYEIRASDIVEITSYEQKVELCDHNSQKFISNLIFLGFEKIEKPMKTLKITWLESCGLCRFSEYLDVTTEKGIGCCLFDEDKVKCPNCGNTGEILCEDGRAFVNWHTELPF
ncbi:hypothetical protein [Acinetobacter modestus]|uniref:hypothetical protein n=1 Tax=Acinetobacter modestus TaxID=1776740 RepID=UPI003018E63A